MDLKLTEIKEQAVEYDAAFLFGEVSVDPRGRDYAEKLKILLERFVKINTTAMTGEKKGTRAPVVYVPELGYMLSRDSRDEVRRHLQRSTHLFIVITRELCANSRFIAEMTACFGDIFARKRGSQQLVPVFASFAADQHVSAEQLPFGFSDVVGINVTDMVAPRALCDVDARRVRAKHVDKMYTQRFTVLLDPTQRRRRQQQGQGAGGAISQPERERRQALYKYAKSVLDEYRGKGDAPSAIAKAREAPSAFANPCETPSTNTDPPSMTPMCYGLLSSSDALPPTQVTGE